ncbi:MAG: hypothetical protein U0K91_07260 [Acutalibacteraceae bacterium]|nr:hypothetical protein [Acutalibacteraceae bacterium]
MTLLEMKKKMLGLIEELNPESEFLTDDPDIAAKINDVINQILFELARMKKIPKYIEIPVKAGELIDYERIEKESGSEVYQLNLVEGVICEFKAQGTIIKALESGIMGIDFFIYPERITEKTNAKGYEFELSADALEIMPYGVAGDLLKSDVSTEYGRIYSDRYETMKLQLDPRYTMGSITIEGGVRV